MKISLSYIIALTTCLSLNAKEATNNHIYCGTGAVFGKEYMYEQIDSSNKTVSQEQHARSKTISNETDNVYIAENAQVYGKELLLAKPNAPTKIAKKASKINKETPLPVKNAVAKEEEPLSIIVFPDLPFAPSSSFYSQNGSELATITPQQKLGGDHLICKVCRGSVYRTIKDLYFLYDPEQRQKLSIAATQCGELTSFGAQSPPRKG